MRYSPYIHELEAIKSMDDSHRLEYFLTRSYETEEVWGLKENNAWFYLERGEQTTMPIWPYKNLVEKSSLIDTQSIQPAAESLEDFIDHTLDMLIDEEVMIEIMASCNHPGCLISPHRLSDIFIGLIDAGEYTLDG